MSWISPVTWGRHGAVEVSIHGLEGGAAVLSMTRPAGISIAPLGASQARFAYTLLVGAWTALKTVVRFSAGVFVATLEESAAEATCVVVEHDVYAVLSRGRGGGPAANYAP